MIENDPESLKPNARSSYILHFFDANNLTSNYAPLRPTSLNQLQQRLENPLPRAKVIAITKEA
jgi:hypothetical protein